MTLVASTIPNLVSGVSQQPAPSRLRTSGSEMINGFPTIVSGLMKRPPTEFVANLDPGTVVVGSDVAVHTIDRSAAEKYVLIAGESGLALYDELGNPKTITYPNGTGYLPATDMWRKLRFITVADTTFVMNTEKTVANTPVTETRPNPNLKGTVFIRQAVASVAYAIYVNGVLWATTTTSDNTTAGTALEGTAVIATRLAASMVSNGHTAEAIGATVSFIVTADSKIVLSDEFGGRAMTAFTDTIQEFDDLPPTEVEGRLVKVSGNLDVSTGSSYWVSFSNGVWTEDVGYDAGIDFDKSTMPHTLRKQPDGSFVFGHGDWNGRPVGDADSNPNPTFVGRTLNGMFLFKGRLGFLSEENVILSASAIFEDFYRTTVVQLLASDSIDVASATGRISTLYHAASFSDELVLFSDKQQFRLSSSTILSAETVGITNSTTFPCSTVVAPVTIGSSAYFVAEGATNTLAREIFIDSNRETLNGENIGVQVPSYIPKNIKVMTASNTADVLFLLSAESQNELYLYKWYDSEGKKIQSAWLKWVVDPTKEILGMGFLDSYLYLVYRTGGVVRLERVLVGPSIEKEYLLDSQFEETDCTIVGSTVTIPFAWAGTLTFISKITGGLLAPTKVNDTTYEFTEDISDGFVAGMNYQFLYRFSTQYLREENSAGEAAIQDGRLQMRYYSVIYTDTSYFEAWVTDITGVKKTTVFNGRTLADPNNIVNVIPRDTGEFKFPVFGQNEDVVVELESSLPFRCAFGSVEWTASYRPKAKRMK